MIYTDFLIKRVLFVVHNLRFHFIVKPNRRREEGPYVSSVTRIVRSVPKFQWSFKNTKLYLRLRRSSTSGRAHGVHPDTEERLTPRKVRLPFCMWITTVPSCMYPRSISVVRSPDALPEILEVFGENFGTQLLGLGTSSGEDGSRKPFETFTQWTSRRGLRPGPGRRVLGPGDDGNRG